MGQFLHTRTHRRDSFIFLSQTSVQNFLCSVSHETSCTLVLDVDVEGWGVRGGELGKEGEEKQKADCAPYCCQWWPLWLLLACCSPSQTCNKTMWPDRGSERVVSIVFTPPTLHAFSVQTLSVIIRILHNRRVGEISLSGTVRYELRRVVFASNVSFLHSYRTCPSVC